MIIEFIKKIGRYIAKNQPSQIISDMDLEYLLWISNIYLRIKNIPGHIAEVGVYDGRNSVLFGKLIKLYNEQSVRQYIGFDTFEGFTERDLGRDGLLKVHKNKFKDCSLEGVKKRCFDNNVEDIVEFFKGDCVNSVPEILKNHKGKKFQKGHGKFALLYIDCNAFFPAIESMQNFFPYMVPGGYIVIDEKKQWGETSAIINFAKKHSLKIERLGSNEVPMALSIPN